MCQDKNGEVATGFSSMLDIVILIMAVQRLVGLGGPSEHSRTLSGIKRDVCVHALYTEVL